MSQAELSAVWVQQAHGHLFLDGTLKSIFTTYVDRI